MDRDRNTDDEAPRGFPDEIYKAMLREHELYMNATEEQRRRHQQQQQQTPRDSDNIFLSFKHFIDDSVDNLKENFRSFPRNLSELNAKMQGMVERRKQEEQDMWRRWTWVEDSADHVKLMAERAPPEQKQSAVHATLVLLREARNRNAHVRPEKITALYRDDSWFGSLDRFASPMLSEGGACYYLPETISNLPSTARWGTLGITPRWLSVDWFKRSPYSPISLESREDTTMAGVDWRRAFEDLLNASLDKPMTSQDQIGQRIPAGAPQSTATGPGLDWMLSLQCRGILPPQMPSLYSGMASWGARRHSREPTLIANLDSLITRAEALDTKFRIPMQIRADFDALVDEVATPAPELGVDSFAPTPTTELDMYQQLYDSYALDQTPSSPAPQAPAPELESGETYRAEAEDALFEALYTGDIRSAAACISEWHKQHGDVADLVAEPIKQFMRDICDESWLSILNEALRRSDLPDTDIWKQSARERCDQETAERLEQEAEALGLTRAPVQAVAKDVTSSPSKVDVLSSLTTTHTTRLPDGTTTTRVVLKQRFADGREETQEKVHTYQDSTQPQVSEEQRPVEKADKKGWFWT